MTMLKRPEQHWLMPIRARGSMVDNDFILVEEDKEPIQRPLRHRGGQPRISRLLQRLSPTKEAPKGQAPVERMLSDGFA